MRKYMVVFWAVIISMGVFFHADTANAGKKDPFKIAIVSVATYKIVASDEGLGAFDTMSGVLSKKALGTYAAIDFSALNDHAIKEFEASLATVKNVEVLAVSDVLGSDAFAAFKEKVEKSNERYSFLETNFKLTQGLPPAHLMLWLSKLSSDEQKEYMAEVGAAAKELCEKAGADAVWMVQNYPGYGTKGLSKFMSKATMGSGKGVAKMTINYVLLDKNGEEIVGKTNRKGKSNGSMWMKVGKVKMDEKMQDLLKEAITNGAKKIAGNLKKPIKKAQKK